MPPETGIGFLLRTFAYAIFAAIGGLMGYLMRSLDKGHRISYGRALIEACAAGFVGILVTLMCMAINLSTLWTGVVVGVFGWLGATASIAVLESQISKRLGISRPSVPEEEPHAQHTE